jgi:hypothetical protein
MQMSVKLYKKKIENEKKKLGTIFLNIYINILLYRFLAPTVLVENSSRDSESSLTVRVGTTVL